MERDASGILLNRTNSHCMSITYWSETICTAWSLVYQGRSHQIWSGQVRCACATTRYARGCRGMLPPEKFGNLGAMRLILRQFLGQYNASRRPDDSKFQLVPVCLGELCGCQPSSGTKWQCQASHDEGKSGPVETGLTELVATALYMRVRWKYFVKSITPVMLTLERHIIGLLSQSVDQYRCDQWNPNLYLLIAAILHFAYCMPVHTLVSPWTVYTLQKLKCNSHSRFTCNVHVYSAHVYSAEKWVTCWAKLTECCSDLQMRLCKLLFTFHGPYMWLTWHTSPAFHACWHAVAHRCLTMSHNSWP